MQGLEKIQGCHCPGPLQDAWKRAPAILPASLRSVPMSGATPLQTVEIHLQRGDSMGIDPKKGMGIDKLDDNGWEWMEIALGQPCGPRSCPRSRRQPSGVTPPRRAGKTPPHCPQPAAPTHEHWRVAKRTLGEKTKKKTTNNQPPILGWLLSRFLVKLGMVCSWVYHIELDIATSFLGRPLEGDHAHSTDGAGHLEICDPLWNDITTWLHLRNQHLIPQKDT